MTAPWFPQPRAALIALARAPSARWAPALRRRAVGILGPAWLGGVPWRLVRPGACLPGIILPEVILPGAILFKVS